VIRMRKSIMISFQGRMPGNNGKKKSIVIYFLYFIVVIKKILEPNNFSRFSHGYFCESKIYLNLLSYQLRDHVKTFGIESEYKRGPDNFQSMFDIYFTRLPLAICFQSHAWFHPVMDTYCSASVLKFAGYSGSQYQ
jgi:hypothetical protein